MAIKDYLINTLSNSEIIGVLDGFVGIANDIRDGAYDCYGENYDIKTALDDFKDRYPKTVTTSNNIMLEDWFLLLEMFFMKNRDLKKEKEAAIQGFERLILDAIYNDGKIQSLYNKMSKKVKRFFCDYDNIFTLNYDNNIENLTGRKVYHLHGDFSVLANSENTNNVQGFLRAQESNIVVVKGMEHCFCNALLNYSGALKYKTAKAFHDSILKAEKLSEMEHLCGLVKEDMKRRNPKNEPTDREEFDKSRASISYIALQEGVLPTTLYMICDMNMDILKNDNEENS